MIDFAVKRVLARCSEACKQNDKGMIVLRLG